MISSTFFCPMQIRETWYYVFRQNFFKRALQQAQLCKKGFYYYQRGFQDTGVSLPLAGFQDMRVSVGIPAVFSGYMFYQQVFQGTRVFYLQGFKDTRVSVLPVVFQDTGVNILPVELFRILG